MITNTTLSATNSQQALSTLQSLIKEPWTILAVLGNDQSAQQALQICYSKINSGHPYYAGVRCLHIPAPKLVLAWFKSSRQNPDINIDWDNMSYLILSISAVFNNIGYAYTAQKYFEFPEAKTDRLVLKAQAADLKL